MALEKKLTKRNSQKTYALGRQKGYITWQIRCGRSNDQYNAASCVITLGKLQEDLSSQTSSLFVSFLSCTHLDAVKTEETLGVTYLFCTNEHIFDFASQTGKIFPLTSLKEYSHRKKVL